MSGMNIQSLSVCVPTHNKCVNNCAFCVSRTHTNPYEDRISKITKSYNKIKFELSGSDLSLEYKDYCNRLLFARDNGCNVVVLTGTGEPIQNINFLNFFNDINKRLSTPFKNIELQTTGIMLDEEHISYLRNIGVSTISLSISNIFDNDRNLEVIGCNEKLKFNVFDIIKIIKKYDFNLRLSLNLINDYDNYSVDNVIERCKNLDTDQVTFRKLYKSNLNCEIDKWIENNSSIEFYNKLIKYVQENGKYLGNLPFGPKIYDIKEMSICIDSDCMAEEIKDSYKYLILRENAKLYSRWDFKSSLIF